MSFFKKERDDSELIEQINLWIECYKEEILKALDSIKSLEEWKLEIKSENTEKTGRSGE